MVAAASGTVPERFHVMEKGEWVIDHPFSYAGATIHGEGTNNLLMYGLGDAFEYKKIRAEAHADTYAYLASTTGGSFLEKGGAPPPVVAHEHTRETLYIPGVTDTIICTTA